MSWIVTYTGKKFYPSGGPQANQIDIIDIAHALSHMPRFAGHTEKLYSVAQHSVVVSAVLERMEQPPIVQFEGLLHDASEAYMMDLPMPIKRLPELEAYRRLESDLIDRIYHHFNIRQAHDQLVKTADIVALATEARDLMGNPQDWPSLEGVVPIPARIVPLLPSEAKIIFLERYLELTEKMK